MTMWFQWAAPIRRIVDAGAMGCWLVLLSLFMSMTVPAWAWESAPVTSNRATATLVTDADTFGPGGRVRIGLRLRLADGWHTIAWATGYWLLPRYHARFTQIPTPETPHEHPHRP